MAEPDREHVSATGTGRASARLFLRIDLASGHKVGPGKIALLETIQATGSISAAGRALGMSYRRAWMLTEDLNRGFADPVVTTQTGGRRGGGAALTELGRELVACYRGLEHELQDVAARRFDAIAGRTVTSPGAEDRGA